MTDYPKLKVYLLGSMRITADEQPIALPTRKVEALLAFLLLNDGQHNREKLAAQFWPDVSDDAARASLRNALSTLRRHLGADLLKSDRETVQIVPDFPIWVDAQAFRKQAELYLAAPSPDLGTVDLTLFGGDLLADFYDDWILQTREQYATLYRRTLLEVTQQMRSQGEYEQAIALAEQALYFDPALERAHQQLMFCYAALGDRNAALRQYESCRTALQQELAVEPDRATETLYQWIQQAPGERLPVEAAITNLPIPLTPFIGRRETLTEVKALLASVRLLTLTGAAGTGKTRVAIRTSTDVLEDYPDGVWWVDIAPLDNGDELAARVAKTLGVREKPREPIETTMARVLGSRKLLLVLDNCDQLLAASARLVEYLLRRCARLTVLATSRERLGVPDEQIWTVPPLSLPDLHSGSPIEKLLESDAVHLFVRRAAMVRPGFQLTEDNAAVVIEICARLEGLPLAIELAAARTNFLGLEQIAIRLSDVFSLLSSGNRTALPRHQTMRAAIDWSVDLLSQPEKTLLRRLSVFAGGWKLEAAEAICGGDGLKSADIVELSTRLAEKSLLEVEWRAEQPRYRLLQVIRQYGAEIQDLSDETASLHQRHLSYFADLTAGVNPRLGYFLTDAEADKWMPILEADYDNLAVAIGRAQSAAAGHPTYLADALRLAGNLHWYWFARGEFSQGRDWLTRLLALGGDVAVPVRARALLALGYLACWQGDFAAAKAPFEEALSLYRQIEDDSGLSFALHGLGFIQLGEGEKDLGYARFEEALKIADAENDVWLKAFTMHFLAIALDYQGGDAMPQLEQSHDLLQQIGGHRQGQAFSLVHMGRIARQRGHHSKVRSSYVKALRMFRASGDRRGVGYCLEGLMLMAVREGTTERAACLAGAVSNLANVLGPFLEAPLQTEYDQGLAELRQLLGETAFEEAFAVGYDMTLDEAIALALDSTK